MGIFDILNPNIFKPLAGRHQVLFAELLDLCWDRCKRSKDYSMEKEAFVSMAEHYFETLSIVLTLDDQEKEQAEPPKTPHEQALWAMNRLRWAGWLEDVDVGYAEAPRIGVVASAVPLLQAFGSILHPQTVTYSGKLFRAYQLLQSLGHQSSPYENILKEVSLSMDELNGALRNLNASIGTYIEQLTRNRTPDEVLELFEQYEEKIVVAAYHRFKTSDNLFFYRSDLQSALDRCEDAYLEPLTRDYMRVEQVSREAAAQGVLDLIQKIRDDLSEMGLLMRAIDDNHLVYRKRAVQRAQFMLLSDGSTQGNLNELLRYYSKTVRTAGELDQVDDSPLSKHLRLYPVKVPGRSFLKPPVQNRNPTPIQVLDVPEPLTAEELQSAQQQLIEYAARAVTLENVNVFAAEALSRTEARRASELADGTVDQFIKIISLHTYSNSPGRNYDVELCPNWVRCGSFRFQEFLLKRKV